MHFGHPAYGKTEKGGFHGPLGLEDGAGLGCCGILCLRGLPVLEDGAELGFFGALCLRDSPVLDDGTEVGCFGVLCLRLSAIWFQSSQYNGRRNYEIDKWRYLMCSAQLRLGLQEKPFVY